VTPIGCTDWEIHCIREEREIWLVVSLKREDGIVTGTFHSSKE